MRSRTEIQKQLREEIENSLLLEDSRLGVLNAQISVLVEVALDIREILEEALIHEKV